MVEEYGMEISNLQKPDPSKPGVFEGGDYEIEKSSRKRKRNHVLVDNLRKRRSLKKLWEMMVSKKEILLIVDALKTMLTLRKISRYAT